VRRQGARFLPDSKGLIYMQGLLAFQDFWLLDLAAMKSRRLTRLQNSATMRAFDITPDRKQIVFDRLRGTQRRFNRSPRELASFSDERRAPPSWTVGSHPTIHVNGGPLEPSPDSVLESRDARTSIVFFVGTSLLLWAQLPVPIP
jgi:hypothetical protein